MQAEIDMQIFHPRVQVELDGEDKSFELGSVVLKPQE